MCWNRFSDFNYTNQTFWTMSRCWNSLFTLILFNLTPVTAVCPNSTFTSNWPYFNQSYRLFIALCRSTRHFSHSCSADLMLFPDACVLFSLLLPRMPCLLVYNFVHIAFTPEMNRTRVHFVLRPLFSGGLQFTCFVHPRIRMNIHTSPMEKDWEKWPGFV